MLLGPLVPSYYACRLLLTGLRFLVPIVLRKRPPKLARVAVMSTWTRMLVLELLFDMRPVLT